MTSATPAGGISARLMLRVIEFCRKRGHDAQVLCDNANLSLATLNEPDARIPYERVIRLTEQALALVDDPDFGLHLAADVQDEGQFDAGLLLLMASPTVGVALERFVANQRYWGDGDRATLLPCAKGMTIRYALPGVNGLSKRHANECAMAEIALGVKMLSGQPVRPLRVRFDHARPAATGEHERVFGCPFEFDAPHTEIVFDRAALDTKMQHANEAFLAIFERQMEVALGRLPSTATASDAVRGVARAALAGGDCTLAGTAQALGTSQRTLQRRLQQEGTSFAEVVDALRRQLALAYLERRMPLPDVATLLGYADVTAFHHAFRRWTGVSPARYAAPTEER